MYDVLGIGGRLDVEARELGRVGGHGIAFLGVVQVGAKWGGTLLLIFTSLDSLLLQKWC